MHGSKGESLKSRKLPLDNGHFITAVRTSHKDASEKVRLFQFLLPGMG